MNENVFILFFLLFQERINKYHLKIWKFSMQCGLVL